MKMKKLTALLMAGVCAFSLALTGCGGGTTTTPAPAPSNAGSNDSGAVTAPKETLKVSMAAQSNSGQVFQYLAEARGYLAEEGVEVEMVYINNGTDAFTGLAGGKVDILSTYGTGGPLIQIANGQEFTIFGGYMIIGETPCYAKPETEYNGLQSFIGKTIAITRGGTPDIVMKSVLWQAGLLDQVTFVEMKTNQDTLQAVVNGEADFGATATGYELQAAALGLEIKMWPDDYYPQHSCCRMLCTDDFIANETNQEALYRLFRAYLRAEKDMQDTAVLGEVVDLVVKNLDLDKATVESFIYSPHMEYNTDPNGHAVEKMWLNMSGFGYLPDTSVKLADHFNSSIYEKALTSLIEDYPDETFYKDKLEWYHTNNDGAYDASTDPYKIVTDITVNLTKD